MTTRLLLVALLASLPTAATAQSASHATAGAVRPRSTPDSIMVVPASPRRAMVCDDSEFRRTRQRRAVGGTIALGTLAVMLVAAEENVRVGLRDPGQGGHVMRRSGIVFGVGLPIFLGALSYGSGELSTTFWERAIANLKVGETRSADVRACLREPRATSTTGVEEQWTYAWERRGNLYTLTLTFTDGVLAGVRRSRVELPLRRQSAVTLPPDVAPLVPVPPDPLPPR